MQVREIMTPNPVAVSPDAALEDVLNVMLRNGIHEVLVLDDERLAGIVTERDLRAALGPGTRDLDPAEMDLSALDEDVGSVMTEEVETIRPHAPLSEACRKMSELRVGSLPVVDAHGRLRGILSVTDVLLAAADLFEEDESPAAGAGRGH